MDSVSEELLKKTRKWKETIKSLLFGKSFCGICLKEQCELKDWNNICVLEKGGIEKSLRNIIETTFFGNISTLLPTTGFCEDCVTKILSTYFMVKKIQSNHTILQKYFDVINEQMNLDVNAELPMENQLVLTVDNVLSLNVPTTVTQKQMQSKPNIQIFLCELDNIDLEPELYNTVKDVPKYECPYCGQNYNDYLTFKQHYNEHKEKFYRCYRCAKRVTDFEKLIAHRKDTHSEKLSTCDLCKIILLSPTSNEHMEEHSKTFMCHVCQKTFDENDQLKEHLKDNHLDLTCQCCYKNFNSSTRLDHHRCLFKCPECKDGCIHEVYLMSYREQHMAKLTEFKCVDCDFKYSSRSQLICHVNEEHLSHYPYLCDLCGENFASRPNLTSHNYRKHPEVLEDRKLGSLASSVLVEQPLQGVTIESYLRHCKEDLNETIVCPFCDKTLSGFGKLSLHVRRKHSKEIKDKFVVYQCSMCPLDFLTETDFEKHVMNHPVGTKHVCRECDKTFLHAKSYNSHIKKHGVKYDKQCPICFKKYTKYSLQRHMKLHHVEKKKKIKGNDIVKCEVCEEQFLNETALIKHASQHTEITQCTVCLQDVNGALFSKHMDTHMLSQKSMKECPYCNYSTKFSACLEGHINRHHLQNRPYKCDTCPKKFFSEYTLRSHKLTHSSVRPELYCHICGSKFISKKAVMLHTRLHTGEKPYPCELCELSFISASRRRQHVIRRHFEPSVECEICNKKLYTQSDLRRHLGDCHSGEGKKRRGKKKEVIIAFKDDHVVCQEIVSTTDE